MWRIQRWSRKAAGGKCVCSVPGEDLLAVPRFLMKTQIPDTRLCPGEDILLAVVEVAETLGCVRDARILAKDMLPHSAHGRYIPLPV
jgi:hypothetical protein